MKTPASADLARTTFQLLAIGILVASSFWILRPFLIALTWATTIVVATWPLMLGLQRSLGGRRSAAVGFMTTVLLLMLLVPMFFGFEALVRNADQIAGWSDALAKFRVPQPPAWLEAVPLLGARVAGRWRELAALSADEMSNVLSPHARNLVLWLVRNVGNLGVLFVQFLLTVVIAAILYAKGEAAALGIQRFARRLAGDRGADAVQLSAQAIRGVSLGVVVTALVQTTLSAVGLLVIGVPFATVLIAITFMLCIAQIGPGLVLFPVVFWAYSSTGAVWGTLFLLWSLGCSLLDNVLRPILIRRGADLPLLLIFAGVIGGLLAFGVIGLFIGPVVLAVAYTLLIDWVFEEDTTSRPRNSPSAT
jgi:predicted PurR-regulated permease PerM